MQRENRVFANKMAFIFKFANLISIKHCITNIYAKIDNFYLFFSAQKRGENRRKFG